MQKIMETEELLDVLNEGLIIVSDKFELEFINKAAKSTLDIDENSHHQHSSGVMNTGDIVVIADNRLSNGDGGISIEDLGKINIHDKNIMVNDIFIGVGIYNTPKSNPQYKFRRASEIELNYTMNIQYEGHQFDIEIDETKKNIRISVDSIEYDLKYLYNTCHMVALSGSTKKIKFFQKMGYSYRNEDASSILSGRKFMEKTKTDISHLIGKEIDINGEFSALRKLLDNASHTGFSIENQIIRLREKQIASSIYPVLRNGTPLCYAIKINKIADLQDMIKQNNSLINLIQTIEKNSKTNIRDTYAKKVTGISGESIEIKKAKYLGFKASEINTTILLTGESGTGKSLMAKEIHRLSKKNSPFVHINCGSIPSNLFESELFGYEKGSFTGASQSGKNGYFEMAHNGTIFLDEVGELPHDIQSKLLHVLQEQSFYKIGAKSPTSVNTRVIAATNVDLNLAVKENRFRRDLYYRLNVFPIYMPPLRERKNDLRQLMKNIMENLAVKYKSTEKILSEEACEKLLGYEWPGNIRELENILERAVIVSETNTIYSEHINIINSISSESLKDIIAEAEKKAILETLDACNNNKKIAMRKLGISKSTFYDKMCKYGIDIQ